MKNKLLIFIMMFLVVPSIAFSMETNDIYSEEVDMYPMGENVEDYEDESMYPEYEEIEEEETEEGDMED